MICGNVEENTHRGITEDPAEGMGVYVCPDALGVAQGVTTFLQAEPIDAEVLHHESPTFRTGRLADCKRMHLPKLRVCAFRLNSYAFNAGITAGKSALTKILVSAVADQVDIIVCDANLFTNRNFRSDRSGKRRSLHHFGPNPRFGKQVARVQQAYYI